MRQRAKDSKRALHTAQGDSVAAFRGELVLSPKELFAILDCRARYADVAANTTTKRYLGTTTVLLSEVRALQLRVGDGGRKLLELHPVDAIGDDEGEEGEGGKGGESGEQHGG